MEKIELTKKEILEARVETWKQKASFLLERLDNSTTDNKNFLQNYALDLEKEKKEMYQKLEKLGK